MGRRRREEAELEALARRVWGDGYYDEYMRSKPPRRFRLQGSRVQAAVGIGVGVPMLLTAAVLSLFVTAASAHVSSIDISCTAVRFTYDDFPSGTTATSHEVVSIDRAEVAERDFTFVGPSASDTISISVPFGTHRVEGNDAWTFDGRPQGSASDHQHLSYCSSTSTTTAPHTTSTTSPHHHHPSTSTTAPRSTTSTTSPRNTTSSAPETTSSVPTTATTAPESTTTTVEVTTTTARSGSTTTTAHGTTSTSSPVHNLGSTTTTTPVGPQGSTVPPGATSTASPPGGNLPFTGSGRDSLIGGLFAVGVGLLALGLTSLRKTRTRADE